MWLLQGVGATWVGLATTRGKHLAYAFRVLGQCSRRSAMGQYAQSRRVGAPIAVVLYMAAPMLFGLPAFLAFLLVCPLLIVSYVLYRVCSTRSRGYAPLEGIQHAEHDE